MIEPIVAKHSPARLGIWLLGLVILLGLASLVAWSFARQPVPVPAVEAAAEQARPAFTPEVAAKLRVSSGFDAVVSYTGTGFEPASLSLQSGQTVRFANNSSRALVLAIAGGTETIAPRDFFEHTFSAAGTFRYGDGGSWSGSVEVK